MTHGFYYALNDLIKDGYILYDPSKAYYMYFDDLEAEYIICKDTKTRGRNPIEYRSRSEVDACTMLFKLSEAEQNSE